jgi:hypothetical protein
MVCSGVEGAGEAQSRCMLPFSHPHSHCETVVFAVDHNLE